MQVFHHHIRQQWADLHYLLTCSCIMSQAAAERIFAIYLFLKNLFHHWIPVLVFMELCQEALFPHPAWDSLMLGSFGVATPQHNLQHQLGPLSLTPTQTELLGTVTVHSQTHWGVSGAFSWDGGDGTCFVGIVLWSRHYTTGQSSSEGEEESCSVRTSCQEDLQENVRMFIETRLSKQFKEKGISRACCQRSSGWRLPRRDRLKTCDFCQEKKGFSSDYRGIIAEEVEKPRKRWGRTRHNGGHIRAKWVCIKCSLHK